jgi:hypothetical protein
MIQARVRTTGVHKHSFKLPGIATCQIIDVGGERAERRKWDSVYNGRPTVLFFVPMGDYDKTLYEYKGVVCLLSPSPWISLCDVSHVLPTLTH